MLLWHSVYMACFALAGSSGSRRLFASYQHPCYSVHMAYSTLCGSPVDNQLSLARLFTSYLRPRHSIHATCFALDENSVGSQLGLAGFFVSLLHFGYSIHGFILFTLFCVRSMLGKGV